MTRRRAALLVGFGLVLVAAAGGAIATRVAPARRTAGVLAQASGSGTGRTATFTASGPFTLNYQFECSSAIARGGFGTTGTFDATIRNPAGDNAFDGREVFDQGSAGFNSRVFPSGGRFYVDIRAECDWHVSVVNGAHPARSPAA